MNPGYKNIPNDEWDYRIDSLYSLLSPCRLCPRECGADRLNDKTGFCRSGKDITISSTGPHFGEERPLSGSGGSGTIFLTNCNLGCVYCQNYEISHLGYGRKTSIEDLAASMLLLQKKGCHNINFVTPTHFTPQIVKAVRQASQTGLYIPIVYNCGGYESRDTIKLLDGIIDIYMPDIKYSNDQSAQEFSAAPDYFEKCKEAVKEMHRQVGDLKTEKGIANQGLLIRHLVLPDDLAGSKKIMQFISREISKNSYVNIMGQYHPAYNSRNFDSLRRRPTLQETDTVKSIAKGSGLHRGFNLPMV